MTVRGPCTSTARARRARYSPLEEESLSEELRQQLGELLGVAVEGPMVPVGRGYTPALRRLVRLADGRRVFVKAGTNNSTAQWLRDEQRIYTRLDAPFLARHIAFADGERS